MAQIKQFIERAGIYIFFISLMLSYQISWMKRHHDGYKSMEIRLLLSFFVGMLLTFGIIKLIKKITGKINEEQETFLNNLSIALSPGIFLIFSSTNKIFFIVTAVLCILTALYIWVAPFRDFIKSIIYVDKFKNILTIKGNNAVIKLEGTYEKANPDAMQSFLIDTVINFYECLELKVKEVKIDFSNLREKDENELKPIIESIARYFNLRIV